MAEFRAMAVNLDVANRQRERDRVKQGTKEFRRMVRDQRYH